MLTEDPKGPSAWREAKPRFTLDPAVLFQETEGSREQERPDLSHLFTSHTFRTAASLSSLDQPPTHLFYVKALEATLSNSTPAHICSSEAGFKVCMGECAPDCILRKVKRRWSTTQEEARV